MEFPLGFRMSACGKAGIAFQDPVPDASIQTIGKILSHTHPVLFQAELSNGKIILAHLSRPLAKEGATFTPGQQVILELTPFDFDQARILGPAE